MTVKNKKPKTQKISKIGREVLEGLNESLDFLRGKPTDGNVVFMYNDKAISIKDIRTKLGFTCDEFAKAFAFKTRTIQNWEQGIRVPPEHVLAYLLLIATHPKHVYKTINTR